MELDRSQFIQPKIPQPIETSCPYYDFPLLVCTLPPPAGRHATATASLLIRKTSVSNYESRIADMIQQQLLFFFSSFHTVCFR